MKNYLVKNFSDFVDNSGDEGLTKIESTMKNHSPMKPIDIT